MRRFYRTVAVRPAAEGFDVLLDERPVRTPARAEFRLPTLALAEAVAEEWRSQPDKIEPASMPLTQLANTAIDRVAPAPEVLVDSLLAYAGTDLVCYRAEAPAALVERQQLLWQPLLDWLAQRHDAPLKVHHGVLPRPQPDSAVAALRRLVFGFAPFQLAGLAAATQVGGSFVIALAMAQGRISPGEAFELAELDASFQIERWGEDAEAAARRRSLRQEIADIHRFLTLLPPLAE